MVSSISRMVVEGVMVVVVDCSSSGSSSRISCRWKLLSRLFYL